MDNMRKLLIAAVMVFILIAGCSNLLEEDEEAFTSSACASAEECMVVGDQLVQKLREQFGDLLTDYEHKESDENSEEQTLVTYGIEKDGRLADPEYEDVDGALAAYQEQEARHQYIWDMFRALVPSGELTDIIGFIVMTDGHGGTLASVEPSANDIEKWLLAVDIKDAQEEMSMRVTLLHEMAHILTLKKSQLAMDEAVLFAEEADPVHREAENRCSTYFVPGMGCTRDGSYLYRFFEQFWADRIEEWRERGAGSDEAETALFYEDYENEFVTEYAATNAEEDIAESWVYYLLSPRPEGNERWEEKLLFFYQYPELVELRVAILNALYEALSET